MATVSTTTSTISSEALGLLDCFADGFDEIVYNLAQRVSVARTGVEGSEITVADMEKAATHFVEAMKRSDLPEDLKPMLASMLNCFSRKVSCRK